MSKSWGQKTGSPLWPDFFSNRKRPGNPQRWHWQVTKMSSALEVFFSCIFLQVFLLHNALGQHLWGNSKLWGFKSGILPETNSLHLKMGLSQKERKSSSNHPFSGAMLVSGTVILVGILVGNLSFSSRRFSLFCKSMGFLRMQFIFTKEFTKG